MAEITGILIVALLAWFIISENRKDEIPYIKPIPLGDYHNEPVKPAIKVGDAVRQKAKLVNKTVPLSISEDGFKAAPIAKPKWDNSVTARDARKAALADYLAPPVVASHTVRRSIKHAGIYAEIFSESPLDDKPEWQGEPVTKRSYPSHWDNEEWHTSHEAPEEGVVTYIASARHIGNESVTQRGNPNCTRCGGSGHISYYNHVEGGRCFACN